MAVEGSLDLFSLPEILQMISQQGKTGILTVQGQQDIVAVSFLLGRIVAADSLAHTVEEGLSKVLVSEGILGAADFARANAENQAAGARLLDFLVERRYLTREQLLGALRLQTVRQLESLLRWQEGDFKFYGGDEVSFEEGFEPIAVEDLLLRMLAEYGALRAPASGPRTASAVTVASQKPGRAAAGAAGADGAPVADAAAGRAVHGSSAAGSRTMPPPAAAAGAPSWQGRPPSGPAMADRPADLELPAIPELPELPMPEAPASGAGRPLAMVPPPGAARGSHLRPVAPAPPPPPAVPAFPANAAPVPRPASTAAAAGSAAPRSAAGSAAPRAAGPPAPALVTAAAAAAPPAAGSGAPAGAASSPVVPPEPIPWPAAVFSAPPGAATARPRTGAGIPARTAGPAGAGGAVAPPAAALLGAEPIAIPPGAGGATLPKRFRQMQIERPEVPFLPRLAVACLALALAVSLVAVVRRAPQNLVLPFPWEQGERNAFVRNQRESLFYKIDGAAKTAFLRDGRFPDSLAQLCDSGLLAPADLIDPRGEPLQYSAREDSYALQATEGGKPLADAGASESIAGNFLLDPALFQPNAATGPPIVLLD